MWTSENRGSYDRGKLRYPSDVTDGEWAHIAPLIPPAKRGGRKRGVDIRGPGGKYHTYGTQAEGMTDDVYAYNRIICIKSKLFIV